MNKKLRQLLDFLSRRINHNSVALRLDESSVSEFKGLITPFLAEKEEVLNIQLYQDGSFAVAVSELERVLGFEFDDDFF